MNSFLLSSSRVSRYQQTRAMPETLGQSQCWHISKWWICVFFVKCFHSVCTTSFKMMRHDKNMGLMHRNITGAYTPNSTSKESWVSTLALQCVLQRCSIHREWPCTGWCTFAHLALFLQSGLQLSRRWLKILLKHQTVATWPWSVARSFNHCSIRFEREQRNRGIRGWRKDSNVNTVKASFRKIWHGGHVAFW